MKVLKGKNVTLTFPGKHKEAEFGVNYYIGDEIPEQHEDFILADGGELEELEEVKEEKVEKAPKEKDEKEEEPKKDRYAELKAESKEEQVEMLKSLGQDKVPKYEKDRIELIIKLEKSDE